MPRKAIKLRLDGDGVQLVLAREVERWTGLTNAPRAPFELLTPQTVSDIRHSLLQPRSVPTQQVCAELTRQLEDGRAFFFEVPQERRPFDAPPEVDIRDLLPEGQRDYDTDNRGAGQAAHWISVVCVSASGHSYAGARARVQRPGGRFEYVTLDDRSSVRIDDLTDTGSVRFELSGDAQAGPRLRAPKGTRYELGAPLGLSVGREHVLVVHPNPEAFVSVLLMVDGEAVRVGEYTLTTQGGSSRGPLDGGIARAEGMVVPSRAAYSFEGVILPRRPDADPEPDTGREPEGDPYSGEEQVRPGTIDDGPTGGAQSEENAGVRGVAVRLDGERVRATVVPEERGTTPGGALRVRLRSVVLPLPSRSRKSRG